jgi:hypothetical protein
LGGIWRATSRSELNEWSTGFGMAEVSELVVPVRPMGLSTFWRSSVASGLFPIMDRTCPRIMKLVCA